MMAEQPTDGLRLTLCGRRLVPQAVSCPPGTPLGLLNAGSSRQRGFSIPPQDHPARLRMALLNGIHLNKVWED